MVRIKKNRVVFKKSLVEIILADKYGSVSGVSLIDRKDYDKIKKYVWSISASKTASYVQTKINGAGVKLHRFILDYTGELDIDHINRDGLDNRRKNLRLLSRSSNMLNNGKGSCSVHVGRNKKYQAVVCINYQKKSLGYYHTREEALKVSREYKDFLINKNK